MVHLDKVENINQTDFLAGAYLLVNKPKTWTSFDVVNKLRYQLKNLLGVKKIKVGHAGTLDPLADGLLIICVGKATKSLDEFQGLHKVYTGTITLGATTPSYDAETEIDQLFPIDHISPELLNDKMKLFLGDIEQVPPVFSALKKNGIPLYRFARKGEKIMIPSRKVTIEEFKLVEFSVPEVRFEVKCSKGTYIRSLAFDLGIELGSGAYLSNLKRIAIGRHKLVHALELEELVSEFQKLIELKKSV